LPALSARSCSTATSPRTSGRESRDDGKRPRGRDHADREVAHLAAAEPGDAEQQRGDACRGRDHPDRERPHAASRWLDRRVGELADREQRRRDERRSLVDLTAVEQRDRVNADGERERELEQRAPATREADRERDDRGPSCNRERDPEDIGLKRGRCADRCEKQQRSGRGQRALRA
jgi:hypothetical protein